MIIKNVDGGKLHAEFNAVGLFPYPVTKSIDGDWNFKFEDDVDMVLVQSIIDAHDPTPIPPQPSEIDILRDYVLEMEFKMIMKELEV